MKDNFDTATFGAGCFWCSETIFERVKGVIKVTAGYSGADEPKPDYQLVSTGHTRFAEVVRVIFNPKIISYDELLEIFWKTHNPTTIDHQGTDFGPQYRSVVFYHNKLQKTEAEKYKKLLDETHIWDNPIITEISPFIKFYRAESYHQNYFKKNPQVGYCNFVITPKLKKFEKLFKNKMKHP